VIHFKGIDLFCGAGGVTTGIERARYGRAKIAEVVACINHDPIAIESHSANHSKTIHFTEDIKDFDVKRFPKTKLDEDTITYLWASLECTNFSNAKGGLPRDADSRTLANHLFRYVEHLSPDYIFIENVREFMSWGDLDENGKPVSKDKGQLYNRWINKIKSYGYQYEFKILNAADYGAHTSRKRLFIIFAKAGMPIVWPEATHAKELNPMFKLKRWRPVKEVLDFSDKGKSIFREKPLSDKTYKRIYAGLIKYVAGGEEAFITKWFGNNQITGINNGKSIEEPAPVITTQNRLGLVSPEFLTKYFSGDPKSKNITVDGPAGTITTKDHHALVQPEYLINYHHSSEVNSINKPCPTITTKDKIALVQPAFLTKYHGRGENVLSTEDPCSTLSTKDRLALIQPEHFLDYQHSQGKQNDSVENPCGSLLTVPKQKLVTIEKFFIDEQYGASRGASIDEPAGALVSNPKQSLIGVEQAWLMQDQFNNVGRSVNEPSPTILASRHNHYLMNPPYYSKGASIDDPCFTLIARMDKRPPYLVTTDKGEVAIEIYKTDSPIIVKIKQFMAAYGIIDIKMRMLKIPELLKIQGFGKNYKLVGTQAQKKKFIGNAVVPVIPKKMIEALYKANLILKKIREAA